MKANQNERLKVGIGLSHVLKTRDGPARVDCFPRRGNLDLVDRDVACRCCLRAGRSRCRNLIVYLPLPDNTGLTQRAFLRQFMPSPALWAAARAPDRCCSPIFP